MNSSYQISTEAYEGPIDLFYDLVVADRIDPADLSLSRLVENFLSELFEGTSPDLDHVSEFVLVVALLCRLKARRLLGTRRDPSEEDPMGNPDRDLWYRLAYLTFGEAVQVLAGRLEQRSGLWSREAGPDWTKLRTTPELAFRLDPVSLAELAKDMMSRASAAPDLDHLALDLPSIEEAIDRLWHLVSQIGESSFEELSDRCADRVEEAVWFMGLMELARRGEVKISQTAPQRDIKIRPRAGPVSIRSRSGVPA